jgi:glutathione synthase/RimK-type ligase-like ATP-grasp enzyme
VTDIVLVSIFEAGNLRDEVEAELSPLVAAFARRSVTVRVAGWDDPSFDWSRCGLAVLRATWNYHRQVDAFLSWAARVPRLFNPPAVVKWNARKTYLKDLAQRGVPTVPTEWIDRPVALTEVLERRGWSEAVLKPTVSGGSFRTLRFRDPREAQPLLEEILTESPAMLQPYLPSVETSRERSLVFFDGELSHVVKRHPPLSTGLHGGVAVEAEPDERALAAKAVDGLGPLLYARVDVARDENGRPCLMELELIEPSFFLETCPEAADLFAAAVLTKVQRR